MKISDALVFNVIRIPLRLTIKEAVEVMSSHQVSDLMVVDEANRFVGVLSEGDLIRTAMPRFEELAAEGTLASGFEIFRQKGKSLANSSIEPLVIKNALTVSPSDDLLAAASLMVTKQIRRLPVVENGNLVGTISRTDVCRTMLKAE
jgi:CBS domain-containing protein